MFANTRQDKIYELIQNTGGVTTSKLVQDFGVSIETIRRDLLFLESKGQITRVHGGAILKANMRTFSSLDQRNHEFSKQKTELSKYAMKFIKNGDVIGIDAGSTALYFAKVLKEHFTKLTVITHSLDVFNILCNHEDFSVILCGGIFNKQENSFYGSLTLDALSKIHMQKVFLFPSAVSIEHGICDYQDDLYLIQLKMLKSANEVYILADSSKFEKNSLLKLDDMKNEYHYITDSGLSENIIKLYEENNIKIVKGAVSQ